MKDRWFCQRANCGLPRCNATATGAPVLIDFERSAIDERAIAQQISPNRTGLLRRWLKPLLSLTNGSGGVTAMEKAGALLSKVKSLRVLMVGGGEQ